MSKKLIAVADLVALSSEGIPAPRAAMLILFGQGYKTTEVRRALSLDRALMSINTVRLKNEGFITTKTNRADRRMINVKLTDEGRELLEKIQG